MNVVADSVVATIDTASAHVGSDRPARKYSRVFCFPRETAKPTKNISAKYPARMNQLTVSNFASGRKKMDVLMRRRRDEELLVTCYWLLGSLPDSSGDPK